MKTHNWIRKTSQYNVPKEVEEEIRKSERIRIINNFRNTEDYKYALWTFDGIVDLINSLED